MELSVFELLVLTVLTMGGLLLLYGLHPHTPAHTRTTSQPAVPALATADEILAHYESLLCELKRLDHEGADLHAHVYGT